MLLLFELDIAESSMNSHIWEKDDPRRFRCVRYLFWLVCWTPIVMITLMTLYGYYAYVIVVCVLLVENDVQRIFYLLTVHILLLLYASTFFRAVFARQALVPQKYRYSHPSESEITLQHALEEHARREQLILHQKTPTGDIRYCQKCELIKPDRAHHCSACNRCILKMDHHCPWINNCCAYSNYKYFVLFVNYAFLICVFVALSAGPYCLLIFLQTPLNSNYQKYNVLVVVFLCIAFAFSTAMLGFFHIYLASRNSSTMESAHPPLVQGRRCKDAFHLGYRRNLELVFGANIFLGFIPIDNRPGNGYEFELAPSLDAEGNSLFIDSRNLPTNDSAENPSAPSANNIRSSPPDSAVRVENSADNDSESGEESRLLS